MNTNSDWYKRMLNKYGSDEEISRIMSSNSNKSSRNRGGTGGYAYIKQHDPEKLSEIQRANAHKRWGKYESQKTTDEQNNTQN